MKIPLLIIASFFIWILFVPSASGYTPEATATCTGDSTGTGGSLPGMGWGDTTNTTTLKTVRAKADTAACYDLSGKVIKNNTKTIIIKNGKCQIIK